MDRIRVKLAKMARAVARWLDPAPKPPTGSSYSIGEATARGEVRRYQPEIGYRQRPPMPFFGAPYENLMGEHPDLLRAPGAGFPDWETHSAEWEMDADDLLHRRGH